MLLSFRDVRKAFGATRALAGVTGEVDGRAIGLLGPNGAGKTTLMKICLGLLRADSGQVRVLGRDVRADPMGVRMRLGYAAEDPGRLPGLSGLESVAYAGELCGLSRRRALLRGHEMLDLVGLDEARHRPVETYSTGMHQRIKVAMALVHDPELVLLDEPTSGLDPKSRDDLLDLIVHLRDGAGPAVLLSTHLLHDVERTCDGCLIMDRGLVRFVGRLADLQKRPQRAYEVRVRGAAAALQPGLQARGARAEPGRRPDTLVVELPEGAEGPAPIWQAAGECGALIWHLEAVEQSLEEAFLDAIGPGGSDAGAG